MKIKLSQLVSIIFIIAVVFLAGCENKPAVNSLSSDANQGNDQDAGTGITTNEIENAKGVLLKFKTTVTLLDQQQALTDSGLKQVYRFTIIPGLIYAEPLNQNNIKESLALLLQNTDITYAEPDYRIYVNSQSDTLSEKTTFSKASGSLLPRDLDENGNDPHIIAILDTGVNFTHSLLEQNIWVNEGEIPRNDIDEDGNGWVDDIYGWNFVEDDNNPLDYHQHGTHVAGIISGNGGNGTTKVDSIKLLPLRVMNENGVGRVSYVIKAFEYVLANNIILSNNSWGLDYASKALFDALQVMNNYNHLAIFAAGNNGQNLTEKAFYPVSYKMDNLLSVASLASDGTLSSFSNYGAASIELAVPGENVESTVGTDNSATLSGSSMAAATVSNIALQLSIADHQLTGQQLKQEILQRASNSEQLESKIKDNKVIRNVAEVFADPEVPALEQPALAISVANDQVAIGETVQLQVEGGVAPFNWNVRNRFFANVDSTGLLQGLTVGSTGVSVTDSTGKVSNEIIIEIVPMSIVIAKGDTFAVNVESQLSVKGGIAPYVWNINDASVAAGVVDDTDSSIFTITPIKEGEFEVTLTDSVGNVASSGKILINALSLSVTPAALQMTLNQSLALSASGGDSPYDWFSSDANVITVNDTGLVTSVGPGDANVIITDSTGNTKAVAVKVLAELTISSDKTILAPGERVQLSATGGSGNYQWVSSDSSVVAVDSANPGNVEALKPGFVNIIVSDGVTSGKLGIEVRKVTIIASAGVSNVISVAGQPLQLKASGGAAPYTWTVNDSNIANVSESGLVTAKNPGSVKVSATDANNFNASYVVVVDPAPLTLSHSNAVMANNTNLQLVATGGDGNYSWSSDNSAIASVDTNGLVTAQAEGSATITLSDGLSQSLSTNITVSVIGINAQSTQMLITDTNQQLTALGGTAPYIWSVSDTNIASIDSTGLLTANSLGTVRVTVTDSNLISAAVDITVTVNPLVINLDKAIIGLSDRATLTISGGDTNYSIANDNQAVITIDGNGLITPLAVGTAKLTVTDGVGQTVSVEIEVRDLTLTAAKTYLVVGEPALALSVSGGVPTYTWTSSDITIATISDTGLVVAQSAGTATITVKDADGFTATLDISVSYAPLIINQNNQVLSTTGSVKLSASGGDGQYSWNTTNPSIVTIDNSGLVTAQSIGSTTVTVSDGSGQSASISVEVRQVQVSSDRTVLSIGETGIQLQASGGSGTYTWGSTDSSVVSVTSSGLINAEAVGSAVITATDSSGFTGSITITVEASTLNIADNNIVLGVGDSYTVSVAGGDGSYSWSSSDNAIATVNSAGTIQAVAAGTATIRVTDGLNQSVSVNITVREITLSASSTTIDITQSTLQLSAAGGNGAYSWSSSNTSVATISSNGLLTAKFTGSVTITATDADGISGTISITITATDVSLSANSGLIGVGGTLQLTASGGDNNYSWSTSNSAIASVGSNGLVTGVSRGTVTITVTDGLGQSTSSSIIVRQVSVSASSNSVDIGKTLQINASNGASPYSWSVNNGNASINSTGLLTGQSAGSVTVTATDADGFTATLSITITVPPMTISSTSALLAIGNNVQLSASGGDGSFTWSSSNTSVASVSSSGRVTANAAGTATITVRDNSGNSKTASIEVRSVSLSAGSSSVNVGSTLQINASGGASPYSWSSSNTNIATVNNNGVVSGVASGTVTITATDDDGFSGTISITVNSTFGGGGGGGGGGH